MLYRKISLVLLITFMLAISMSSHAQDNLLQNPGFNDSGAYASNDQRPAGSSYSFAIAVGWNGWFTNSPSTQGWMNIEPIAYPHTGATKMEGDSSQNIGRGDATITVAVHQTVNNISEGTTLRFRAWAFQDSETGSGSQTRVGIGSNTGGNPFGSPITWSPWMTSIDSWQEMTVEATVPAGSVTVFIYSTQSVPKPQNQNYYDQASLVVVGAGDPDVGDGGDNGTVAPPPPPTSTPQNFVPFVQVQPTQESGRIEHTVNSGDTIASIAVAYGIPSSEILALNGLSNEQARFLTIGQVLLINEGNPVIEEETVTEEAAEATEDTAANSDGGFASPTVQEVAQEATVAATEILTEAATATDGATQEPTADISATPSEIPATATDAATAPVEQGADNDPLEVIVGVCVLMFNDANSNNIQDGDEALLSGGTISIEPSAGEVIEYITDGSEPFCFTDLAAGLYTIHGTGPDGFGVARNALSVSVQPDQQFTVRFAAVEGLEVAVVPTIDSSVTDEQPEIIEEAPDSSNNLRNIAGIIVLGLAGVILLGGIGMAVLAGRR